MEMELVQEYKAAANAAMLAKKKAELALKELGWIHITYENPEPGSSIFLGDELIYGTNTKKYDLGKQKNAE